MWGDEKVEALSLCKLKAAELILLDRQEDDERMLFVIQSDSASRSQTNTSLATIHGN